MYPKKFEKRLENDIKMAKYSGQPFVPAATFIEYSNGVIQKNRNAITIRRREYFSDLSRLVVVAPTKTQERHVMEDIQITEADATAVRKSAVKGKGP